MVHYNPFDPEVQRGDTYKVYRQLRDEAPCYYIEEFDAWALSRFHDIWEASQDTEHYTATKGTMMPMMMALRKKMSGRALILVSRVTNKPASRQ